MSKHWALANTWNLAQVQVEQLEKYYLLHWKPTHFLKQVSVNLEDSNLYLDHQDVTYKVRLIGFRLTDCLLDKNVLLSFRKHKEEEQGVVLVTRNKNECPA